MHTTHTHITCLTHAQITSVAGKKKVLSDFNIFGDTLRTASSQALDPGTPILDFIRHRYNLTS